MARIIIALILYFIWVEDAAAQEFGWLGEGFATNMPSNSTYPGGRKGSSVWQDASGNVWMFGGLGFPPGAKSTSQPVPLNDLWRFSLKDKSWRLESPGTGSESNDGDEDDAPSPRHLAAACGVNNVIMVVFGGLGTEDTVYRDTWVYYFNKRRWLPLTSLSNFTSERRNVSSPPPAPPARWNAASWCLPESMYVFGGISQNKQFLQDMWEFTFKDLKWDDRSGVITSDVARMVPEGRSGASTWAGRDEMLYMFGGNTMLQEVSGIRSGIGYSADLWRLSTKNFSWALLSGTTKQGGPAIFGRLGEPSQASRPGSRCRALTWVDSAGNLWMFGGDGMDTSLPSAFHASLLLADLWRYTLEVNMWVWMGGSQQGEAEAVFTRPGFMSGSALPGARTEAVGWLGKNNHFFMFGGMGWDGLKQVGFLNDVWELDVSMLVGYHTIIPGGYVFLIVFLAVGLLVGLIVTSIFAKDRQGSGTFGRRIDYNVKYSQLGDGLE